MSPFVPVGRANGPGARSRVRLHSLLWGSFMSLMLHSRRRRDRLASAALAAAVSLGLGFGCAARARRRSQRSSSSSPRSRQHAAAIPRRSRFRRGFESVQGPAIVQG